MLPRKWTTTGMLLVTLMLLLTACEAAPAETPTPDISATPTEALAPTATPIPGPTLTPTAIPYETPDWFDHATLYEIFVRSFADSDGDGIGDLNGITGRLDYLESLGVDVIWLMPINPSPSYHGYDVTDYYAINPDYGTMEDFQTLVDAAHARGIRVLLDFVASHLSNQNPLFEAAYGHPGAENEDWFLFTNDGNTSYAGFSDLREMPRFNHHNQEVVDYLTDVALYWLDLDGDGDYTDGVDGFRVDNAIYPPKAFFVTLRQQIKAANPEALLLGEAWVTSVTTMNTYYQDEFDALFDFPLYNFVQSSNDTDLDGLLAGKGIPVLVQKVLLDEEAAYPAEAQVVRFFGNHDTNRIASEVGGDVEREKLAATLLATMPGTIMVYYGDEIGMLGDRRGAPWYDAYRREPMDWYTAEVGPDMATWFSVDDGYNVPNDGISVEEETADPGSLLNHWRDILALRESTPGLLSEAVGFPAFSASGQNGWVMTRGEGAEMVVAVFNFSMDELEITLGNAPVDMPSPTDLVSGASYPAMTAGEAYTLTLPPGTGVLLGN